MIRHGRHVSSQCPKQKHSPGISCHFEYFRGDEPTLVCMALEHAKNSTVYIKKCRPFEVAVIKISQNMLYQFDSYECFGLMI